MFWRKHFSWGPPLFDPHIQRAMRNSQFSSPSPETHGFSVVGEHSRLAGIVALLQLCRPSAIAGFVVSIVIRVAVDGCLGKWLWSHIGKKVDKRLSPSLADRDSSTAVEVVSAVSRVAASPLHLFPTGVFRRTVTAALGFSPATARLGASITLAEIPTSNCSCIHTFTAADPQRITAFGPSCEFNYRQFPVDVATLVFHVGRQLSRIVGSHLNFLFKFKVVRAVRERHTSGRLALLCRLPLLRQVHF